MPIEQELTIAAMTKWVLGEPVSSRDFERILTVITQIPLQMDIVNKDQMEGAYARLREGFKQVYNA